jgi:hypothetical protein
MLLFFSYFNFEYYKLWIASLYSFFVLSLLHRHLDTSFPFNFFQRPSFIKQKTEAADEGGEYNDHDDDDDRTNV